MTVSQREKCRVFQGVHPTEGGPDRALSQFAFPDGSMKADTVRLLIFVYNQRMLKLVVDDLSASRDNVSHVP